MTPEVLEKECERTGVETVDSLPEDVHLLKNSNEHANNFVRFKEVGVLEYYTVTGDNANKPNEIVKETFVRV